MSTRKLLIWLVFVAVLALLPLVFIARLRGPEQVPAPAYWPTQGWRNSLPEEQGFDSAKLAEGLQAIRQKDFNIHSLLIIRNGSVVVDRVIRWFFQRPLSQLHERHKLVQQGLLRMYLQSLLLRLMSFRDRRACPERSRRVEKSPGRNS